LEKTRLVLPGGAGSFKARHDRFAAIVLPEKLPEFGDDLRRRSPCLYP
jgi:hypothetical protein